MRKKKYIQREEAISLAMQRHGDKYDYSQYTYKNFTTKGVILCPKHGPFEMTFRNHAEQGQGCPKCAGRGLSTEEVVERFRETHGGYYDYSKVTFTRMHDNVTIICPRHGEFPQTPSKHINGRGCRKCATERSHEKARLPLEEFVRRGEIAHKGKYDYRNVHYSNLHDTVEIICPKHGKFQQRAQDHLKGHGCPGCGYNISHNEQHIYEYVCNIVGKENVVQRNRTVMGGRHEIDIYVPSRKIGIEYNGMVWHSEKYGKDRNYHLNKLEACNKAGVRLIQIYEDEYTDHETAVLARIRRLLGGDGDLEKVSPKECNIAEIGRDAAKEFIWRNYVQGLAKSSVRLGAFKEERLVAVMTFTRRRDETDAWFLSTFASDNILDCTGVECDLFKYFVNHYIPNKVIAFADRRWETSIDDNIYTRMGFRFDGFVSPGYKYVQDKKDPYRIWDCGRVRYVYDAGKSTS